MRNGFLALLTVLAAGAGVSRAQSYPGNPALPVADPVPRSVPASPPVPPAEPVLEGDMAGLPGVVMGADPSADLFWVSADYLLWWTKNGPLPVPLVTTGPMGAAILGGLTQPDTRLIFGSSDQDYRSASGLRVGTGVWMGDNRSWALEGSYFLLERRATGFSAASDAGGNPILAQPLLAPNGSEFTELIALPGFIAGGVAVSTHSRLQGWEVNAVANVLRTDRVSLDVLAGFRTANLDEDLQVAVGFSPLLDQFLTFEGQRINTPSTLTTFDGFQAQNHFYGPQLGGRLDWKLGPFTIAALGKVGLGDNQELVRITGTSALSTPGTAAVPIANLPLAVPVGTPTTVPGGVLAQVTNIGDHFRDRFAVLPEVGIQVGYQITHNLEAHVGYSFLYWSDVVRPGNHVDRTVEAGLVPTDPLFGTATGTRPSFQFHSVNYWAHGINFGLGLRF